VSLDVSLKENDPEQENIYSGDRYSFFHDDQGKEKLYSQTRNQLTSESKMSSYLLLFSLAISASIGAVIPNPTATSPPYLKAFDVSLPQATYNPNFWNCTYKNGYQKVVMRGYQVSISCHPS